MVGYYLVTDIGMGLGMVNRRGLLLKGVRPMALSRLTPLGGMGLRRGREGGGGGGFNW